MPAPPELVELAQDVHARLRGRRLAPPPRVTFYAYADAKSTIRERQGRIHIRLTEHLRDAPEEALRGVFGILLSRLYRIGDDRLNPDLVRAYRQYLVDREKRLLEEQSERVQQAHLARALQEEGGVTLLEPVPDEATQVPLGLRTRRGRKHIDPVGAHRSLLESYLRVTLDMGLDVPLTPKLSWSQRVSGHRFGHWDPDHQVIVISQILDDPEVPEFVLDYVVYHEILHILHPVRMGSGSKRIVHSAAFYRDERKFPQWQEGEKWINKLARKARWARRWGQGR